MVEVSRDRVSRFQSLAPLLRTGRLRAELACFPVELGRAAGVAGNALSLVVRDAGLVTAVGVARLARAHEERRGFFGVRLPDAGRVDRAGVEAAEGISAFAAALEKRETLRDVLLDAFAVEVEVAEKGTAAGGALGGVGVTGVRLPIACLPKDRGRPRR